MSEHNLAIHTFKSEVASGEMELEIIQHLAHLMACYGLNAREKNRVVRWFCDKYSDEGYKPIEIRSKWDGIDDYNKSAQSDKQE